jgi:hypothetical protein
VTEIHLDQLTEVGQTLSSRTKVDITHHHGRGKHHHLGLIDKIFMAFKFELR